MCCSLCQTQWRHLSQTSTSRLVHAARVSKMDFTCCCLLFNWHFWKPSQFVDSMLPHQLLINSLFIMLVGLKLLLLSLSADCFIDMISICNNFLQILTQLWYVPCHFCHAMLCISAAYAIMWCLSVCLCVCVSDTFVNCVKTNKHILNIFSLSSRAIILHFPRQTA